uniref:Uncharacterized protein n=1 Tax=Enterobacter cloacae TaxID=550 RepID=A0A0G3B6L7_ENTCL|nr:hypothetical protein [Enterobacter cloacae]
MTIDRFLITRNISWPSCYIVDAFHYVWMKPKLLGSDVNIILHFFEVQFTPIMAKATTLCKYTAIICTVTPTNNSI